MEQNNSFRTAGFGGFHRQDVLDYIERTAKEHTRETEGLTAQLEAARRDAQSAEAELSELRQQLEAANARAQALETENGSLQAQLEPLLAEGRTAQELRDQAEGYRQLKDDFATIELEAHCRASSLLEKAKAQADTILTQARAEESEILARANAQAESIQEQARQQAERTIAQASDEAEHIKAERRQLMARTRRDFVTASDDLKNSVTGALREVDALRQDLSNLSRTFEENAQAVEELCEEGEQ
ncbi:MAG: hypothetical protein LUH41_03475 [Clostridiales bacterium]|nr:hypothetical protein [Clostridiales bacterium]